MKINSENLNINLRHLQAIHAIAREGSFSAAADSLGIVSSALSEIVRQTESNLGALLFDRAFRPPKPTPLAQQFIEDTAHILQAMENALKRAKQNIDLEQGSLAIGASPSAISSVIAPVLKEFLKQYPHIQCIIHDDISEHLARQVINGELDFAIAGKAVQSNDITQTKIAEDHFGLVCSKHHPISRNTEILLKDIPTDQLIGLSTNTGIQHLLEHSRLPEEFTSPSLKAHSTIAQLCMVREGLGVALLPCNAATIFQDPSLCFIKITDLDLTRALYLLEPANRALSIPAITFLKMLNNAPILDQFKPLISSA